MPKNEEIVRAGECTEQAGIAPALPRITFNEGVWEVRQMVKKRKTKIVFDERAYNMFREAVEKLKSLPLEKIARFRLSIN